MAIEHIIERMVVQLVLESEGFKRQLDGAMRDLTAMERAVVANINSVQSKIRDASGHFQGKSAFIQMYEGIVGNPQELAKIAMQATASTKTQAQHLKEMQMILNEAVSQGLMKPGAFQDFMMQNAPNLKKYQEELVRAGQRIISPNVLTQSAKRIREDMDRATDVLFTPKDLAAKAAALRTQLQREDKLTTQVAASMATSLERGVQGARDSAQKAGDALGRQRQGAFGAVDRGLDSQRRAAYLQDMNRAQQLIFDTSNRAGQLAIRIKEVDDLFARGNVTLAQHDQIVRGLTRQYNNFGGALVQVGRGMQVAGFTLSAVITAPIVGLARNSLRQFSQFQDGLLAIQAQAQPTAEQMDRVKATALDLSASLKISPTVATSAFEELLKAGVPLQSVLNDAGEAAIKFARVGKMEAGPAAVVLADAMHVFHRSAEDAANVISGAADASSVSIQQMVNSFSQSTAVAGRAGLSLEDTAAAIAVLGNEGIKSGMAGSALSTMLARMLAPTRTARDIMRLYGIQLYDTQQQFIGLDAAIEELSNKLGGLDEQAKNNALFQLFGMRGIKGAAVFLDDGLAKIEEMRQKMKDANSVTEKYNLLISGASGTWKSFASAVERFGDSFGEVLVKFGSPILDAVRREVESMRQSWEGMGGTLQAIILSVGGTVAAFGPLLLVIGSLTNAAGHLVNGLNQLGIALSLGSIGTTALGAVAVPLLAASLTVLAMKALGGAEAMRQYNDEIERNRALLKDANKVGLREGEQDIAFALSLPQEEQLGELENVIQKQKKSLEFYEAEIRNIQTRLLNIQKARDAQSFPMRMGGNIGAWLQSLVGIPERDVGKLKLEERLEQAKKRVEGIKDVMELARKAFAEAVDEQRKGVPGIPPAGEDEEAQALENMKEAEAIVKSLRSPIQVYQDEVEHLRFLFNMGGLSAQQFSDATAEAFKRFESADPFSKLDKSLEEHIAGLKAAVAGEEGNAIAIMRHRLALMDLDAAERAEMEAKLDQAAALEDAVKQHKEEEALLKKHTEPMEKYKRTVEALNKLLDAGKISQKFFNHEMREAKQMLNNEFKDKKVDVSFNVHGIEALEAGSAALNAILLGQQREGQRIDFGGEMGRGQEFDFAGRGDAFAGAAARRQMMEDVLGGAGRFAMGGMGGMDGDLRQEILNLIATGMRQTFDIQSPEDFFKVHAMRLLHGLDDPAKFNPFDEDWLRTKAGIFQPEELKFKEQFEQEGFDVQMKMHGARLGFGGLDDQAMNEINSPQWDKSLVNDDKMVKQLEIIASNTATKNQPRPIVLQDVGLG